ncbi:MAG: hypothetical protein IJW73_00440, partial [Candidatus Gastranaerophilales bacterium]|nr:hypothetical protein [Candidatus Gastranaerophilales bacterium]
MDATNTNFNIPWQRQKEAPQANNAQYGESAVNDIDYLYFTNDTEKERTTFNGTYTFYSTNISQAEASAGATDGYHFYKALI